MSQTMEHALINTIDLLTVRILIEEANKYHQDLYLAFVDYEKADTVESDEIESKYRIPIYNIYNNATKTIQLQETTRSIPIKKGLC